MPTSELSDLTGRTALVTGAGSGIGLAVATRLAARGAHVVVPARDPAKAARAVAAIEGSTEVRPLDLADLASVHAFAAGWDGPIDLLVNNAGVGTSPALRRTADGFELMMGTNHFGHFALTLLLLRHVTGRVVTVSSQAERMARLDLDDLDWRRRPYRSSRAYGDSKLANLLFTSELQRRLAAAGSPVLATAAHPGLVRTNIYDPSARFTSLLMRVAAQSPEDGALPVLYAASADVGPDAFAGPAHLAHMRGAPMLIGRSAVARDADLARRLWAVSEERTGVALTWGS